ncbi:hypothetical protein SS1G_06747 [Sclerotinia sclerotiorum 1980 UF-70]|uniref:Uncharacterized protein n=1 Tax=Sclerotinia sclerotiorum (strain ATCC 18683 / 1980 / Ss-1) TaxID=665079 RepID=A7EN48_SCLS1|nr:hypothetical protein SS1G_06747 [Sclerotinia sclerotiorum 1980 UF-70]EDO04264.1 hypothetical protein SS1G_06747 [Sclerotinia sclerotiorum 1980 UF-70]
MYTNLLTVASLCAVVLASPQLNKREDGDTSSSSSTVSSILESLSTSPTASITSTSPSTPTTESSHPTITAPTPVTGIINGTTATLVPVGTGGLTIASTAAIGGNSTVTTGKLTSSTEETAAETGTGTKTRDKEYYGCSDGKIDAESDVEFE